MAKTFEEPAAGMPSSSASRLQRCLFEGPSTWICILKAAGEEAHVRPPRWSACAPRCSLPYMSMHGQTVTSVTQTVARVAAVPPTQGFVSTSPRINRIACGAPMHAALGCLQPTCKLRFALGVYVVGRCPDSGAKITTHPLQKVEAESESRFKQPCIC